MLLWKKLSLIGSSLNIDFSKANQYWSVILLVGAALGVANYALGIWPSLGQSLVLQVLMSVVIGYPLIVISFNESSWWPLNFEPKKRYLILVGCFILIGLIGSELQLIANHLLFNQSGYQLFHAGGVYMFNGILTSVLGFMTLNWTASKSDSTTEETKEAADLDQPVEVKLSNIPLRKGESTTFMPLENIIYFEAYDNYSFLYDTTGKRSLCNYSLAQLEPRLRDGFLRVHRKYLVNTNKVASITPYLKGRFVIAFTDAAESSVTSSNGYSAVVKELIRL